MNAVREARIDCSGRSGVKATASEAAWEGAVQEDLPQLWMPGERNDLHSERLHRRSALVKHLRKAYYGPLLLLQAAADRPRGKVYSCHTTDRCTAELQQDLPPRLVRRTRNHGTHQHHV